MATYRILRTEKAENDLIDIALYIARQNSVDVANKIVDEIENSIAQLYEMPYSGSPHRFTYTRKRGYRYLVVENFLIHYHVDEPQRTVYIDRIRHGSIAPQNQL